MPLAHQIKAIERKREIYTGANQLRLARGPTACRRAGQRPGPRLDITEIGDPRVKYRLDKAVEFLDAMRALRLADKAPGAV